MTSHFDQGAIERAAVILRVAEGYSGDELAAALKAARQAIEYCLKEVRAGVIASRALLEAIDAARSIARDQSLTAARPATGDRAAMNEQHPSRPTLLPVIRATIRAT
jgi:hypothetical protein